MTTGVQTQRPLSQRQAELLAFMKRFMAAYGYPPTLSDMARAMGMCRTGPVDHLKALEKKGYIERDRSIVRGIRILPDPVEPAA